jgi:hypothetical protein
LLLNEAIKVIIAYLSPSTLRYAHTQEQTSPFTLKSAQKSGFKTFGIQ